MFHEHIFTISIQDRSIFYNQVLIYFWKKNYFFYYYFLVSLYVLIKLSPTLKVDDRQLQLIH